MEAEKDTEIVTVHAGMEMEKSLQIFQEIFPDRFFDVGLAEQHAVTFSAGLSCGGLKPFCIIPSTFLQRAYDQVFRFPLLSLSPSATKPEYVVPTNCQIDFQLWLWLFSCYSCADYSHTHMEALHIWVLSDVSFSFIGLCGFFF